MATPAPQLTGHKTLSDLYADRGLTTAQARRLVALLGLAAPRRTKDAPTAGVITTSGRD